MKVECEDKMNLVRRLDFSIELDNDFQVDLHIIPRQVNSI